MAAMNALRATFVHTPLRTGAVEMSLVCLGIAAWGLVTGVAMVKASLSVPLALMMSLMAFRGSVRLAAVPLIMVTARCGRSGRPRCA